MLTEHVFRLLHRTDFALTEEEAPLHSSETCSTLWFDLCGEGFIVQQDKMPNTSKLSLLKAKEDQGVLTSWYVLHS